MGQQQLLLIILGVIIVGVAVGMGILLFQDSAVNENRDAVANDLIALAARAQQYYCRPTGMGGGHAFTNLGTDILKLTNDPVNDNGTYSISTAGDQEIVITGVGTQIGSDGENAVMLTCSVSANAYTLATLN